MPIKDGTGPMGQGPMTGRGCGPCGQGLAVRRGFGRGMGRRCFGCPFLNKSVELSKEEQKKVLEAELKELEEEKADVEKELASLK